jgi:hypothetical protein
MIARTRIDSAGLSSMLDRFYHLPRQNRSQTILEAPRGQVT